MVPEYGPLIRNPDDPLYKAIPNSKPPTRQGPMLQMPPKKRAHTRGCCSGTPLLGTIGACWGGSWALSTASGCRGLLLHTCRGVSYPPCSIPPCDSWLRKKPNVKELAETSPSPIDWRSSHLRPFCGLATCFVRRYEDSCPGKKGSCSLVAGFPGGV